MLPGLDALELGRLRMSVGYGGFKAGRPLSPVEVAEYLQKSMDAGVSLEDCAREFQLVGISHIRRFLKILTLVPDLHHLIAWADQKDSIGFSSAVELSRLELVDEQRLVASAILEEGLTSKEIRYLVQLRKRSQRPISECLSEILGMRTKIIKRYVYVGAVTRDSIKQSLLSMTQVQRDSCLQYGIKQLDIVGASGHLGPNTFTLVGDQQFNASISTIGKNEVETKMQTHLAEYINKND